MSYKDVQDNLERAQYILRTEIPDDLTGSELGDAAQSIAAALDATTNALVSLLQETRALNERVRGLEAK